MHAIRSLVAAIDFSDNSRIAAHRAALLAAELQAKLELRHVISGRSLKSLRELFRLSDAEAALVENARRMLNELVADIAGKTNVTATSLVTVGNVLDEILAASEQADILILGAHGRNSPRDRILGTTAERLVRKCKRPVLVTRRSPRRVYKRVLIPVDFSPYSAAALRIAMDIAPGAEFKVIHAVRVPFEEKLAVAGVQAEEIQKIGRSAQLQAVHEIETLIQNNGNGLNRISHAVEHDKAVSLILTKAAGFRADLIIIGKHSGSAVEELLIGSVTRHVLSYSKCDVLVAQGERPGVTDV